MSTATCQSASEALRTAVKRYITGKAGVPPATHGPAKRFHVVRIISRYYLLASYTDREEAREHVLSDPLRIGGCVLRDGGTGKRFCPAELRAEVA